jgi:hypothetical protein
MHKFRTRTGIRWYSRTGIRWYSRTGISSICFAVAEEEAGITCSIGGRRTTWSRTYKNS